MRAASGLVAAPTTRDLPGRPLTLHEEWSDDCHDRRQAWQRLAEQRQLDDESAGIQAQQLCFLELLPAAPTVIEQRAGHPVADRGVVADDR